MHIMAKIIRAEKLTQEVLYALLRGEIYVIILPSFITQQHVKELLLGLSHHQNRQEAYPAVVPNSDNAYVVDYGIKFIGATSNKATGHPVGHELWQEYFKKRDEHSQLLSSLSDNALTPVEIMMHLMEQLHPPGASKATFFGNTASYGGFRFTYPGEMLEKKPHADTPRSELHSPVTFSVNVYLSVPPQGRELLLWEQAPIFNPNSETLDAYIEVNTHSEPAAIRVSEGDAVLFNSCVPHGVAAFSWNRPSIAQQSFFIGSPFSPILFYN